MITKENYELFYMDYLEGDLDPDMVQELESFLELHPDLKVEDDFMEALDAPSITYANKAALKFENIPNFDDMSNEDKIIAYHEGILSPKEQRIVEQLVGTSQTLADSFNHYEKVYLKSSVISYNNKKSLKRRSTIILWPALVAVAASFTMLMVMNSQLSKPEVQHAVYTPEPDVNSKEKEDELPLLSVTDNNPIGQEQNELKEQKVSSNQTPKNKDNTFVQVDPVAGPKTKSKTKVVIKNTIDIPNNTHNKPVITTEVKKEPKTTPPIEYEVNQHSTTAMHNARKIESPLEDALPDLVNYALNKVSKKTGKKPIEIKKEEDKSLFKGRFKIKIGALELKRN